MSWYANVVMNPPWISPGGKSLRLGFSFSCCNLVMTTLAGLVMCLWILEPLASKTCATGQLLKKMTYLSSISWLLFFSWRRFPGFFSSMWQEAERFFSKLFRVEAFSATFGGNFQIKLTPSVCFLSSPESPRGKKNFRSSSLNISWALSPLKRWRSKWHCTTSFT